MKSEDTETDMVMTGPYYVGDIRSCSNAMCVFPVMFTGYDWTHLPKNGIYPGVVSHQPKPYPEHKHRHKLLTSDNLVHYYACVICNYSSNTSKALLRYLMTNQWS